MKRSWRRLRRRRWLSPTKAAAMDLGGTTPLWFGDLETTGLDPIEDHIIEISQLRVEHGSGRGGVESGLHRARLRRSG